MRLGLMKTSTVLSSISSEESLDGYDQYASCSSWLEKPEKLWEDAGTNIYEFLLPSSLLAPSRASRGLLSTESHYLSTVQSFQ
jgi:hypothetical protein